MRKRVSRHWVIRSANVRASSLGSIFRSASRLPPQLASHGLEAMFLSPLRHSHSAREQRWLEGASPIRLRFGRSLFPVGAGGAVCGSSFYSCMFGRAEGCSSVVSSLPCSEPGSTSSPRTLPGSGLLLAGARLFPRWRRPGSLSAGVWQRRPESLSIVSARLRQPSRCASALEREGSCAWRLRAARATISVASLPSLASGQTWPAGFRLASGHVSRAHCLITTGACAGRR